MLSIKNRPFIQLFVLLASLLPAARASADRLGVNFTGANAAGAPTRLLPGDEAGVVAQTNWNNLSSYNATNYPVADNTAKLTAVTVSYSTSEMWGSGTYSVDLGFTDGNAKLLNGYLNSQDGANQTNVITFKNVPQGSQYTVIAYTLRDNAGAQAAYWVNNDPSTALHILSEDEQLWQADPQFRRGTNTVVDADGFVLDDPTSYGNYVRWDNVATLPNGTIVVSVASETIAAGGDLRGPINGIQLIGPGAFPENTITPTITLQPRNIRVPQGQSAVLTVGTDGPWAIQWYSNDVAVVGATTDSLTTEALTAFEGTLVQYKAVASNGARKATSQSVHLILAPALPEGGIFYDGFDYPVGPLGSLGEWNALNIASVTATGLTYSDGTDSLQVTGRALVPPREPGGWNDANLIAVKSFGTKKYGGPNSTNFMSFLYDFTGLPNNGGIGVSGFEGPADWNNERFFIGKPSGSGSLGTDNPGSSTGISIDSKGFVVIRITQDDSTSTFDMFVNPPLAGLPETPDSTASKGNVVFDGVGVNAGDWNPAVAPGTGPVVDEFRFGTTYSSVAPIQSSNPSLGIALTQTGADISWAPLTPGFKLQVSSTLAPNSWSDVPGGSPVAVSLGNGARFYRLIKAQ